MPDALDSIAARARRVGGAGRNDAEPVPSPCIAVCRMDEAGGLCEGCLRTLDEIAAWSRLGDAGKRVVWRRIGRRAATRDAAPAGGTE